MQSAGYIQRQPSISNTYSCSELLTVLSPGKSRFRENMVGEIFQKVVGSFIMIFILVVSGRCSLTNVCDQSPVFYTQASVLEIFF